MKSGKRIHPHHNMIPYIIKICFTLMNHDFERSPADVKTYLAILLRMLSGKRDIIEKRDICLNCNRAVEGREPARK